MSSALRACLLGSLLGTSLNTSPGCAAKKATGSPQQPEPITVTDAKQDTAGASSIECPPEELLEHLHAAIWHLEHESPPERVAQRLRASGLLSGGTNVPDWAAQLALRASKLAAEPDIVEAEWLRAEFHETPCLTSELNRRFHERLTGPDHD